jgi:hypothetical protein
MVSPARRTGVGSNGDVLGGEDGLRPLKQLAAGHQVRLPTGRLVAVTDIKGRQSKHILRQLARCRAVDPLIELQALRQPSRLRQRKNS